MLFLIDKASILLILLPLAQCHFLWQESALMDINGKSSPVSLFTFAEGPGIDHAETTYLAQKAYDKDVEVYMRSSIDAAMLPIVRQGRFLKADLPGNMMRDSDGSTMSYALEGYTNWGVFGEYGPPSLIQYHTSASHIEEETDFQLVLRWSRNTFVNLMSLASGNPCNTNLSDFNCVQVYVQYSRVPLFNATVTFYDGETDDSLGTKITDEKGYAFFPVPVAQKRLFSRVNYKLDENGAIDGASYESVSNWATSYLEVSGKLQNRGNSLQGLISSSAVSFSDEMNASTPNQANSISLKGFIVVGLVSFVGALIGTLLAGALNRRRYQKVTMLAEENHKLNSNAEPC